MQHAHRKASQHTYQALLPAAGLAGFLINIYFVFSVSQSKAGFLVFHDLLMREYEVLASESSVISHVKSTCGEVKILVLIKPWRFFGRRWCESV